MDPENQEVETIEAPQADTTPAPTSESSVEVSATSSPSAKALLDSISEPNPNEPVAVDAKPAEAPAIQDAAPKQPEDEEAELLAGVKSERGQERIRKVFAERKQLEQDINEFRGLVQSSGMTPQEFAQSLEYGRLISSGDEGSLRTALQMVDAQREQLCKRLGIEAPGVDVLSDFPDLKEAVDNMEITRDRALQLAALQRKENERTATTRAQQEQQQSVTAYQEQIQGFQSAATAYFNTRAKEADFPVKVKQVEAYFAKPENMQRFVSNFEPKQWLAQLQFMYDSITVTPHIHQGQPISSRPSFSGTPNPATMSNPDRLMSRLDQMGI